MQIDHNAVLLFLGKAAAALTAGATIWKLVLSPLVKATESIRKIPEKVDALYTQFQPNGGGSVKDSLDRIENIALRGEQRQRILLGLVPYAMFETNGFGQCVYVNRAYLRITGRVEQEVLGDGWTNAIALEDRDRVLREWNRAIAGHHLFESSYHMVNANDNARIRVSCKAFPMINGSAAPHGYLGIVTIEPRETMPLKEEEV